MSAYLLLVTDKTTSDLILYFAKQAKEVLS